MSSTVKRLPQSFVDFPLDHNTGWLYYTAKTEKTMLPENSLVDPSQNCLIPNATYGGTTGDKILPRYGSQVYYQGSNPIITTEGIIGKYVKYKNLFGVEMDVKAYRDPTYGEQVLVLFNGTYVPITQTTNTAMNGTQKIYFATYTDANADQPSVQRIPRLCWVNGYSNGGSSPTGVVFSWTGGISAISTVTGSVITIPVGQTFRQLGFTVNFPNTGQIIVTINGTEYYSTNAATTLSYTGLTGNFAIGETVRDTTSGALGIVSADTGSVLTFSSFVGTISSGDSLVGETSGATATAGTYTPSDLDTDSMTLNAAPSAVPGDIVTSAVESDTLAAPMFHLRQNLNYMYYGNFTLPQWYMSNQFERLSTVRITSSHAVQNDLIIPNPNGYTGTGQHVYAVTIDSVTPASNTESFSGNGSGSSQFDYSAYTGIGTNTYKMVIISDIDFTPSGSIVPGAGTTGFDVGENMIGGTSGAVFQVQAGGTNSGGSIPCTLLSGVPVAGETYTGNVTGTTAVLFSTTKTNCAVLYKNGVQVTGLGNMLSLPSNNQPATALFQFGVPGNQIGTPTVDGIQFVTSVVGGDITGDFYTLTIQAEKADTFQWTIDGAVQQTFVPITPATATITFPGISSPPYFGVGELVTGTTSGATGYVQTVNNTAGTMTLYGVIGDFQPTETISQTVPTPVSTTITTVSQTTSVQQLSNGVSIQFVSNIGHAVGDTWSITVNQAITRAWANFYYTLDLVSQQSLRQPGEGFIYNLPSNFNTADTFEGSMYVNTWTGDWLYTLPKAAANLLTEDYSLTPLKQVYSSRVLYPYLTGHSLNDLIYIDESHNIVSMGRKELMQLVQAEPISDDVLDKFQELSFLDGDILWQDNALNFTSPHDGTMMVFNTRKQYWQPPQVIPNLGLLTVIDTGLYVHSFQNTATRMLNDPTASGDDAVEYTVIAHEPDFAHGDWVGRYVMFYGATRWNKKAANMAFWEAYVYAPMPKDSMSLNVYLDPGGCSGIKSAFITPKFLADETNQGNLGGGSNGTHVFGSAPTDGQNYARFQFDDMGTVNFYFSAMEFACTALVHPYQILSMGINLAESKLNNKEGRPERDLDDFLPLNSQSTGNPAL